MMSPVALPYRLRIAVFYHCGIPMANALSHLSRVSVNPFQTFLNDPQWLHFLFHVLKAFSLAELGNI
jgi:hypothetical protein